MKRILCTMMLFVVGLQYAAAQQAKPAPADDTEKLMKDTQNPVASLISVPFQNNLNYPIGPFNRYQDVMNIQPVIPVGIRQWNLITRAILPVINRQDPLSEGGTRAGLGDLNATFFLSPAKPGKLIWGAGPILLVPTATADVLGTNKWGAGPSFVGLVQPQGWTIGALTNNVWSFTGGEKTSQASSGNLPQRFTNGRDEFIDRGQKVNSFLLQYFINRNFEQGWFLTTSPIITANWGLPSDERWIVPFGGGIGRVFKVGDQPVMAQVQNFYNAIRPKTLPHPNWQLRMEFTLLFPREK